MTYAPKTPYFALYAFLAVSGASGLEHCQSGISGEIRISSEKVDKVKEL